jgi:hypothetical protein
LSGFCEVSEAPIQRALWPPVCVDAETEFAVLLGKPAMMIPSRMRRFAVVAPVWATRALIYFLLQGVGILTAYTVLGFSFNPDNFPPGLRLDPVHAGVHAVWGAAAAYIGFFRPRLALGFMFSFGIFYIVLAIAGTFTHQDFGMRLGTGENVFHWLVGPIAALIALFGLVGQRGTEGTL